MEIATENIELVRFYNELYNQNAAVLNQYQSDAIKNLRNLGLEEFNRIGFPTGKSERYKYTPITKHFSKGYIQKASPDNYTFEVNDIFKCDVPHLNTDVVLIVNGFYYHKNRINGTLPGNIWIGSIYKAALEKPDVLLKHLGKYASYDDGLIALNTALFSDGMVIHVPRNTKLEKPLQVINVLLSEENLMVQHRNLIVLDENSSANIVFCDHTLTSKGFISNSVTEVYVAAGAHYDQSSMQNNHNDSVQISSTFVYQERSSQTSVNALTLHGGVVRNNVKVTLDGEGADNTTSGLFLTDEEQSVDSHIFINHAKPNCTSNQLFKGILDDKSTGSFNGRILVSPDAQKTIAYQKNSNLLLTSDARMNTRPQLEIYADDVKCSHGATVGQLDQEALFYLRSRGIGKGEARLLMMFAFAHEIVDQIKVQPLKERMDDLVNKRLRGELSRCQNCAIHCC